MDYYNQQQHLRSKILEHQNVIKQLRLKSRFHPELFARTINRHLRDIEILKTQLQNLEH